MEEQGERESQRLWHNTVQALLSRNHEAATDEKTKIEDRQRDEAAKRADEGVEWHPRLFRPIQGGPSGPDEGEEDLDWIINAQVDMHDPQVATKQILSIAPILQGSETKADATQSTVERTDTQTSEVEKFVDAEEIS
ncbi:hypothetical protein ACN38_g12571 [Penicillium nordicum]|uniref:Uncharacterized protein n=1 Tax=Penicillium nordicum TaxID=229535 RepID=A0A0M8NQI0_9EURO|nr:hypothetical protein ACN38_g12571 [Penicillium nordicum]